MRGYNKLILMGNLTRDPEVKNLPSGTQVAEFGVAVNRKWRDQNSGEDREEVTFVDCSAFGKLAELVEQYLVKGKPVFLEGRLKFDSWEDKQGGGKRSKLSMIVDQCQFLGAPSGDGQQQGDGVDFDQGGDQRNRGGGNSRQQQRPSQSRQPQQTSRGGGGNRQPPRQTQGAGAGGKSFRDADIPF